MSSLKGWKDLPLATTVPASTSEEVQTGPVSYTHLTLPTIYSV